MDENAGRETWKRETKDGITHAGRVEGGNIEVLKHLAALVMIIKSHIPFKARHRCFDSWSKQ